MTSSAIRSLKKLALLCSLLIVGAFYAGCEHSNHVETVDVPNVPVQGKADLKGLPKETLDYLKDAYPPDSWTLPKRGTRLAVGPVLLSREALLYLEGDDKKTVTATAESGSSKSMAAVTNSKGSTLYFLAEKHSFETQAIIVESMTNDGSFDVFALDQTASVDLYRGDKSYDDLLREGIRYYVNGNMTLEEGGGEVRVYLRFLDTATKQVICAVSAKGAKTDAASRDAAKALLERVKSKI
jgi:hypothetical protein